MTGRQVFRKIENVLAGIVAREENTELVKKAADCINSNESIPKGIKLEALLHIGDHESFAALVTSIEEEQLTRLLICRFVMV